MCCLSHSNSQRPLHQQRPRRSWKRWLSSEQVAPWVHCDYMRVSTVLLLLLYCLCCLFKTFAVWFIICSINERKVSQLILAGSCCQAQRLEASLFSPAPQKPLCALILCLLFVGLAFSLDLVTLSVKLFQQGSAVVRLR